MKYKYIAYYAEDNEFEFFKTHEEADKWLQSIYSEVGYDSFSEETVSGEDFIAKITHQSKFVITDRKENYKWNEKEDEYINKDGDVWGSDFEEIGNIELKELKPASDK